MSERADRARLVRQWVERAEEDHLTAGHTLKLRSRCPFTTVCFHAQQCVEKYVKAVLTLRRVSFPKTHDLAELLLFLPKDLALPLDAATAEKLTAFATLTRYPGEWEPPDREDAKHAVAVASEVRRIARRHLPREVLSA